MTSPLTLRLVNWVEPEGKAWKACLLAQRAASNLVIESAELVGTNVGIIPRVRMT